MFYVVDATHKKHIKKNTTSSNFAETKTSILIQLKHLKKAWINIMIDKLILVRRW